MKCATIFAVFAATAFAAPEVKLEKKQAASAYNSASAFLVLATALPGSLVSLAITNSPAASSIIASEFAAGETPSWFSKLPSDIKTNLVPAAAATSVAGKSSAAGAIASKATAAATPARASMGMGMPYGTNGTMGGIAGQSGFGATGASHTAPSGTSTGSGSSSTGGSGGGSGSGSSGSGSGSGSKSSSKAGAAMPTAAIGAGLAGVVGMVGLLAL